LKRSHIYARFWPEVFGQLSINFRAITHVFPAMVAAAQASGARQPLRNAREKTAAVLGRYRAFLYE
jgi:hypothetical protein